MELNKISKKQLEAIIYLTTTRLIPVSLGVQIINDIKYPKIQLPDTDKEEFDLKRRRAISNIDINTRLRKGSVMIAFNAGAKWYKEMALKELREVLPTNKIES